MRFAARVFFRCISFFLILVLLLPLFSGVVSAQTMQTVTTTSSPDTRNFAVPNTEPDVPKNQHTLVQSVLIEMLLAIGCQLTGIDLSNPYASSCLGINPITNKLGIAPSPADGKLQIGGLMGTLGNGIAFLYTPTITTSDYTRYLADNFGLVKKAVAAPQNGFDGLSPIRGMWTATRDISYFLLIIAFVFIGIGVMLRIKIDPRTVMTIQNQIPRVIIAIILITFSYAIAAVMIDLMWTSTYVLINVITKAANPSTLGCKGEIIPLSKNATAQILATPFTYVNKLFLVDECDFVEVGIFDLSKGVANAITELERDSLMSFLGLNPTNTCSMDIKWWDFIPIGPIPVGLIHHITELGDIGDCLLKGPIGNVMMYITSIIWALIIFIIVIITLFRIWLELLKAYAMVILYTILSPLFIVINLLPKRPLGFERWIRVYFANLAIFPVTAALIVLSRIFVDAFTGKTDYAFAPPLVGNPNMNNFGVIIGFAILLLIPQMMSLIREKLGVPPVKQTAAIGAAFSAGAGAVGAPVSKGWKHLNRRNPQTGAPMGILAQKKAEFSRAAMRKVGGSWGSKAAGQQEFMEQTGRRATSKEDFLKAGIDTRSRGQRKADERAGRESPVQAFQSQQQEAARQQRINEQRVAARQEPFTPEQFRQQSQVAIELTITTPEGTQQARQFSGDKSQTVRQVVQSRMKPDATPAQRSAALSRLDPTLASKTWADAMRDNAPQVKDFLENKDVHPSLNLDEPPTGTA